MRLTREGSLHFIPGTFTLGRFSKPLHILSIIWLTFLSLILTLPSTIPVTKSNFNYAPVVLTILTIIFAVSWFKARTDFTGGAKDISRASHRIPAHRSLEDIYPRRSPAHSQLGPGLAASAPTLRALPPFHQPPSEEIVQRFKTPLGNRARNGMAANGHNKVLPEQFTPPRPGYPTSLTPPRRDPMTSSSSSRKQQQHQGQAAAGGAGSTSRSSPRDHPRGQAPNLTMNTITSVQSHPDSILGIPFSESPEMMHRELTVQNLSSSISSSPSSSPSPPLVLPSTRALATGGSRSPDSFAAASSGLFLTRPFGPTTTTTDAILPEISIAPPTTNSSMIESARATPRRESPLIQKATVTRTIADGPSENKVVVVSSQQPATSESTSHPLTAVDSIFKLGQGLTNMFTSGKNKVTASMNTNSGNNNRLRTGKNRAPTPYPGSLVDPTEDSAVSDYAALMKDDSRPPKSVLKLSPPSPPLHSHNQGGHGGNGYTIEDIVNNTSISLAAPPSISQFPTLDGCPLIKSPSTMDFGAEVTGSDAAAADSDRRPSNTTTIRPLMLPLSRSPTIQATSQAYTHTSSLDDDHDGNLEGQLAEADEFYENEYHHDYPIISISNNRLNSLPPTSGVAGAGVSGTGLLRLPNRDIGVSPTPTLALTPSGGNNSGGMIQSSSLLTHSTGPAATPTTVMAPSSPNRQQQFTAHNHNETKPHHQSSYTERHDPIERLLLLKAQQQQQQQQQQSKFIIPNDPTTSSSHQHLESATNPALQFLQRTRTVANWAHEQSRIQEKRARHYARTQALKELRKQDPTATLSVRSSSGSSFSDFSELSSFSTSTSSSASGSASGSGASTSKFIPQFPQQHRYQQPSIQARSTPPPSSSSLTREKLVINTNFGEGKMPSFPRHYISGNVSRGGLAIDSTMMEDIQLDQPTRLEMLIQGEDEDEEEPGLYIDTEDVLSPSMEIGSLGAGVGRL